MINIGFGIFIGLLLFRIACSGNASIPSGRWYRPNYDPTDDIANNRRSGMTVFIDYGTGCHYLQTSPFQPLVRRVDKNGKHVCEER